MKDIKIATLTVDLDKSKDRRGELAAWLHEKAEEIKTLDDAEYITKPKWNFIV